MDEKTEMETMMELVKRAGDQLSDHVDSVIIVVTKHNPDGCGRTRATTSWRGNYYAARDSVREWLVEQDQVDREHIKTQIRQREAGEE